MNNDDNGVFGSISKYAVSNMADKEAYTDLRDVAASAMATFPNSPQDATEGFTIICREGEVEFMEANYDGDPEARHTTGKRAGQWKFRTYLPNSYSSSKSELIKGLEAGIDPAGLGKTALSKARTAQTKVERTAEEKIEDYLGKLSRTLEGIDDANVRCALRRHCMDRLSTL